METGTANEGLASVRATRASTACWRMAVLTVLRVKVGTWSTHDAQALCRGYPRDVGTWRCREPLSRGDRCRRLVYDLQPVPRISHGRWGHGNRAPGGRLGSDAQHGHGDSSCADPHCQDSKSGW